MRLYGVGLGRTGTTSLAGMFRSQFRARHEADARRLIPIAAGRLEGSSDDRVVRKALIARSHRLALEVDVAGFLFPLAADLAQLYPDARFVLTIRDCFGWIESTYGLILSNPNLRDEHVGPAHWRDWLAAIFPQVRAEHVLPEERAIEALGLPPVRVALQHWAEANASVVSAIPESRLLVLRTEDLNASLPRIAAFCDVGVERLEPKRVNAASQRRNILSNVPSEYLVSVADDVCASLMTKYWGAGWHELARPHQSRT